jgi:hypothetical protein
MADCRIWLERSRWNQGQYIMLAVYAGIVAKISLTISGPV